MSSLPLAPVRHRSETCSIFAGMPPGTPHYNFADLFELAADKVPDHAALIDARRLITYRELEARTNALAHTLATMGVQPGDHVGIFATNCIEWVESLFAIYKIRASAVNIKYRY